MSKGEYEKALREGGYKNVSLICTDKKDIKQKRNAPVTSSGLIHLLTKMFPPTWLKDSWIW